MTPRPATPETPRDDRDRLPPGPPPGGARDPQEAYRVPDVSEPRQAYLEWAGAAGRQEEPVAPGAPADPGPGLGRDIDSLEKEFSWGASIERQADTWSRMLGAPAAKAGLMGLDEIRRNTPSRQAFLDALRRPELLGKIEQGFTRPLLVPIGLPLESFGGPVADALAAYHGRHSLRPAGALPVLLDADPNPLWLWERYVDADRAGQFAYFPERFDRAAHGGTTKERVLAASPFPGWLVLLLEDLPRTPREGEGRVIGGRRQLEAGGTPRDYLGAFRDDLAHAGEQGLTPEGWLSLVLTHLHETEGEVLDVREVGCMCALTGAYLPSYNQVPCGWWFTAAQKLFVGTGAPEAGHPGAGTRPAVRVL